MDIAADDCSEGWLSSRCCRWRKPRREQLATRQYIDEYRTSQAGTSDDDIVVYQGVDDNGSGLPERSDNSILQHIGGPTNRAVQATTQSDHASLVYCDDVNDFSDETTA